MFILPTVIIAYWGNSFVPLGGVGELHGRILHIAILCTNRDTKMCIELKFKSFVLCARKFSYTKEGTGEPM